ncbi:unnamed protein product [Paramecium octaurelia]|uniref:CRAL-TRIO domain-containing protein n=1 Tax=Paramecium octaurelia TaxID=43137 RepID=A0A8S1W6Y7_PAROT|nr:unnamed protein product [Paramecium octaurelia]
MDQNFIQLTPDQKAKLHQLKQSVYIEAQKLLRDDLIQKYTDQAHLYRLLIAKDWKLDEAWEQWNRWVEWRKQYKADDIKIEEIKKELDMNKTFWNGQDKLGNPCLVIKARRHFPGQSDPDTLIRYMLYMIDVGIERAEQVGTGKITVIWDREGVSTKNFDSSMFKIIKRMITLVQDNYAERLHQAYILYPNFLYKTVMTIVKPFLSERTKQKIILCNEYKDLYPYFGENFIISDGIGDEQIQQLQDNIQDQQQIESFIQQQLLQQ